MARTAATGRTAATNRVAVQDMKCSLSLNGSSSYVSLAQTSGLPLYNTTSYSIAVWFKVGGSNALDQRLYAEGFTGDAGPTFAISIVPNTNNKIRVFLRNTTSNTLINNSIADISLKTTGWNHIVWADKGGVCAMYINGVKSGTNFNYTPAGSYGFNTTVFGAQTRTSTANFLNGNMCNGQLFNYSLSQSQVLAVMNDTLDGNVGSYALQEGAGTIAYDTSGNGNHGTITAGSWTIDTPTKKRKTVNDNLVYNGDFSIAPVVNVPQVTFYRWLDGTAGGRLNTAVDFDMFGVYGWDRGTTGHSFNIDTVEKYKGMNSLKVSVSASPGYAITSMGAFGSEISSIPVLPNTSYTYSFAMKTRYVSGDSGGGARMFFEERSGSKAYVKNGTLCSYVKVTSDWTVYSGTFTTTANTRFVNLLQHVSGNTGTATLIMDAWFADIQLRPTTPTTRSAA